MSEVIKIVMDKNDLQPLADEVKKLRGGNESITLVQMENELLSVNDEVDVQTELLAQIATALEGKVAGNGGIDTSDATASATEIFEGKTAYVDGEKITGTFTIEEELSTQDDLIAQIQNAVDSLPDTGSTVPMLQSKTVMPSTSSQTVVADSGYDGLSSVLVNGDANLVATNIVSGVSIFGVAGNAETSSGEAIEVVTGTIIQYDPIETGTIHYMNANGAYAVFSGDGTISVMKDSILFVVSGAGLILASGGLTQISPGQSAVGTYRVTGNFQLNP